MSGNEQRVQRAYNSYMQNRQSVEDTAREMIPPMFIDGFVSDRGKAVAWLASQELGCMILRQIGRVLDAETCKK